MSDQASVWPVLTHYEGCRLREIAFPLGGIGTGTFCLGGRAEYRDFELFNRPDKGTNHSKRRAVCSSIRSSFRIRPPTLIWAIPASSASKVAISWPLTTITALALPGAG